MAKKSFYAVRIGKIPGVYETWSDCQEQTKGFSGAKYQKFDSKIEADQFVIGNFDEETGEVEESVSANEEVDYDLLVKEALENDRVVAFVDGSYKGKEQLASYGCYIITPDDKIQEISDIVHTKKFTSAHNITAEIFGALEALKWVVANEYEKVTIFHDLEHIGKWARKEYKTGTEISKLFVKELTEKYNTVLDIEFVWVKGHAGIEYNERADQLAAEAIRSRKPIGKYGANSFLGKGVKKEDVYDIINVFESSKDIKTTKVDINGNGERFTFVLNNEKLTVTYFESTGTTLLQGKVESLFSEFISKYTEKISGFEMVVAYSNIFKETIEKSVIEQQTNNLNLPSDYPENAIVFLQQSFMLRDLTRQEVDYSHYVSPAYKALEGHVKYLCSKAGHPIQDRNVGGFLVVDKQTGQVTISNNKLKNKSEAPKIIEAYELYYSNRNRTFHFGEILGNGLDSTFMIKNKEDAVDQINEVISLISKHFL